MRASSSILTLAVVLVACKGNEASRTTTAAASASASAPPASSDSPSTVVLPKHSGPRKDHAPAEAKLAIAGAEPGADEPPAPKESPASVGLPTVDFGAPAAIEIKGYPTPLETGMRDWVTSVAWTKDSSEVVACGSMTPIGPAKGAEQHDTCFFRTRASKKTERAGVEESGGGAIVGPALASKLKILKEGVRTNLRSDNPTKLEPPPLKATWPYANDVVLSIDKAEKKAGGDILRIGGNVKGEDVVWPITVAMQAKAPELLYSGAWNAVTASPDNAELAFVAHFFCMEWCNDVIITRLSHGKLASLVFNDSGFRKHQKKDFTRSRDLFLKATWADPKAPLPPYNLACAYALLNDEANATKALKLAIAVGGEKVKARAKKDADFKAVLGAKWFRDLTD